MKIFVKGGSYRYKVIFPRRARIESNSTVSNTRITSPLNLSQSYHSQILKDELSSTSKEMDIPIPDLFTSFPPLQDNLSSETSQKQNNTILQCLPFLSGKKSDLNYNRHGIINLDRERHISFLHQCLKKLPPRFTAADPSRPWIFYWCLNGLATMGEDVSSYRESLLATVRSIQNDTGGFGGGQGQMSHLACTYAIILSLSIVGGQELYDVIDRKAMWKWLGALKQPSGGFQVAINGEEDVRLVLL